MKHITFIVALLMLALTACSQKTDITPAIVVTPAPVIVSEVAAVSAPAAVTAPVDPAKN
ncbi:MAG: hypothetical protein ABIS30_02830 [Gallionella sp.]|jgi:hypothetical protein